MMMANKLGYSKVLEDGGDVRGEPSDREFAAAETLYNQIRGCGGNGQKIQRLLAFIIRDWNIDIAERDELLRMIERTRQKHTEQRRRYRAKKKVIKSLPGLNKSSA